MEERMHLYYAVLRVTHFHVKYFVVLFAFVFRARILFFFYTFVWFGRLDIAVVPAAAAVVAVSTLFVFTMFDMRLMSQLSILYLIDLFCSPEFCPHRIKTIDLFCRYVQ